MPALRSLSASWSRRSLINSSRARSGLNSREREADRVRGGMARAIKLFWSGGRHNVINFGDLLSPILLEVLAARRVVFAGVHRCEALVIGSIIERYARHAWRRRFVLNARPVLIWGTGTIKSGGAVPLGPARVFSVRGVHTRDRLGLPVSTPLGDPGLLVDLLIGEKRPAKAWRWGIIPHVNDREDPRFADLAKATQGATLIDVGDPDVRAVARKIAACDFVASSSLHGLIAADSFGIPNMRLVAGHRIRGGNWKFDDYVSAVPGRQLVVRSLDHPIDLHGLEDDLRFDYAPDVARLKRDIHLAFTQMPL